MEKRLKELMIQAEDERRSADQYKEQVCGKEWRLHAIEVSIFHHSCVALCACTCVCIHSYILRLCKQICKIDVSLDLTFFFGHYPFEAYTFALFSTGVIFPNADNGIKDTYL